MKVTILQSIAGHADPRYDLSEHSFRPNEIADLHNDLARAWCASGVAEKLKKSAAKKEA